MIQEKLDDEISFNFPEFFVPGKYVRIRFKNIRNILEIEQTTVFLFTFWFHFFMEFFMEKLIHTINI